MTCRTHLYIVFAMKVCSIGLEFYSWWVCFLILEKLASFSITQVYTTSDAQCTADIYMLRIDMTVNGLIIVSDSQMGNDLC